MRAHELASTAKKSRKRSGRGISAGRGKTAGRGTKGQNSRSGGRVRPGFEGGQNPLIARIPKLPGFKTRRTQVQTVKAGDLNLIKGKEVSNATLKQRGLIRYQYDPVKIVAGGTLDTAKSVKVYSSSKTATHEITKAGGEFIKAPVPKRYSTTKS